MQCDIHDADLLKLFPSSLDIIGAAANIQLWTYCDRPDGTSLNAPCLWHTPSGLTTFFGLRSTGFKPGDYHTTAPMVRCTFLEAVRVLWFHQARMLVNRVEIIDFVLLRDAFQLLLADRRGLVPLQQGDRQIVGARVETALSVGAQKLEILAKQYGSTYAELPG